MILFRNCQDAALFGCDLSHVFVASGIKSPSTVLLYLEVRVLNSIRIAMFNNVQQFVIGSRPITSVGNSRWNRIQTIELTRYIANLRNNGDGDKERHTPERLVGRHHGRHRPTAGTCATSPVRTSRISPFFAVISSSTAS